MRTSCPSRFYNRAILDLMSDHINPEGFKSHFFKRKTLRPHQSEVKSTIKAISNQHQGKLIMACGKAKLSLLLKIAEEMLISMESTVFF